MSQASRRLPQFLFILIGLGLVVLAISLPYLPVEGDEAAFAEFAHFIDQDGYLHSELFRGLVGYESRVLLYHKLFEWVGALALKVFGYGIWPLRALSLVSFALIFVVLYRWRARLWNTDTQTGLLACAAFLMLAPLSYKFAKYYRPEMIQALQGLLCYIVLERAARERSRILALGAGVIAGIAMLTHLNGVIFVIAGGVTLVVRRQWSSMLLFGLGSVVAFSPFFYEIIGRTDQFWQQYVFDPTFGENERTVMGTIWKLIDEHKRLFRKPEIIFTTTLFLFATVTNIVRDGWRQRQDFYVFTAAGMIAMGALAPAKTTPYAVLVFPLWGIEVGQYIARARQRWSAQHLGLKIIATAVVAAFVIHSLAANTYNAISHKEDYVARNERLAAQLAPGQHVLAPLDFVLNQVDNFRISGLRLAYWEIHDWGKRPFSMLTLTEYADSIDCPAIILDDKYRAVLDQQDFRLTNVFYGYEVTYVDSATGHVLLTLDPDRYKRPWLE